MKVTHASQSYQALPSNLAATAVHRPLRNCPLPYVSKNQSEELSRDKPERFSIFKIKFTFDFDPKQAQSTAHLNGLLS
jgi:hypothetical protein